MKKALCLLLALFMVVSFAGCDDGFKMSSVKTITVSGPGTNMNDGSNGISVDITSANGSDFTEILRICQGDIKTDLDQKIVFGFAKIMFTDTSDNTTAIYPACDGSPVIRLNSLRMDETQYITVPDADMKKLTEILKKYGVDLTKY